MNADIEIYVEAVRRAAYGRWNQALADAGISDDFLRNKHGPCPGCGGKDRFRFDDREGRGTFVCSQGGDTLAGDGFGLIRHVHGGGFLDAVDRVAGVFGIQRDGAREHTAQAPRPAILVPIAALQHQTLSSPARELWNQCTAISGVGASYLANRSCVIPPADGDLRFHPRLKHFSGHVGPALVGLITDSNTCEPISLHQTWINADGTKADIKKPKLLLKGHRKKGGVIRLWPDECVTSGLGVAEGIESTLSLAHAFRPAWCCIDGGNLAAFPVLPGVGSLTIAADNDKAGLRAAETCAQAWSKADREVRVIVPSSANSDFNDLARAA